MLSHAFLMSCSNRNGAQQVLQARGVWAHEQAVVRVHLLR